jgi:hypothetical protein
MIVPSKKSPHDGATLMLPVVRSSGLGVRHERRHHVTASVGTGGVDLGGLGAAGHCARRSVDEGVLEHLNPPVVSLMETGNGLGSFSPFRTIIIRMERTLLRYYTQHKKMQEFIHRLNIMLNFSYYENFRHRSRL